MNFSKIKKELNLGLNFYWIIFGFSVYWIKEKILENLGLSITVLLFYIYWQVLCLVSLKVEHPPYKWDTADRYRHEVP